MQAASIVIRRVESEDQAGASGGTPRPAQFRRALLRWAKGGRRKFFWRDAGVSPYELLVIEILLARTRAEAVEPVAVRLLARFTSPAELATARIPEVERMLRPLGLHRKRARQLVACANRLVDSFDAKVPSRPDDL